MQTTQPIVLVGGGAVARALAQVLKSFGFFTIHMEHAEALQLFENYRPLAVLVFDYDVREREPGEPDDPGVITWRALRPETRPHVRFLRLGYGSRTEDQTHPDWMCLTGLKLPDLLRRLT